MQVRPAALRARSTSDHPVLRPLVQLVREVRRRALCLSLAMDLSYETQTEAPARAVQLAHRVPFASSLRQVVRHRPGWRRVPVSALVMGSQARLDACGFADAIGSLRYTSMPMESSPHVQLLRAAIANRGTLSDEEIRQAPYFAFGREIVSRWEDFFGARCDEELVAVSRNFIEWSLDGASRDVGDGRSPVTDGVLVAKVTGSTAYMVMDGHHRVAAAIARGETHLRVQRTWLSAESPLRQRLLARGRGLRRPVLAQPLLARDLHARVATNCESRLVRMLRVLEAERTTPGSFLDLAAGTGWYLGELAARGWRVTGVTQDALDAELGELFHGLSRDRLVVGDAAAVAETLSGTYEVVACLDLGAMVAAPSTREDAVAIVDAADRLGAEVLFADVPTEPSGAELVGLVVGRTGLTRVVDLGASDDPLPDAAARGPRLLAFCRPTP